MKENNDYSFGIWVALIIIMMCAIMCTIKYVFLTN